MIRKVIVFAAFAAMLGLFVGLTTSAQAQEKDEGAKPLTKQGSAAFLFTINGLGNFGIGSPPINGIMPGVGVKYFIADDIAIRGIVGFASSSAADSALANTKDSAITFSTSSFGIAAGIEYHFRPLYSTSPYAGLEIGFTSTSRDVPLLIFNGTTVTSSTLTDKTTSFGVTAIAGFDWFFTHGLAVGGEMGLGFISIGGTKTNGASKASTSTIALATSGNVHFVVYF